MHRLLNPFGLVAFKMGRRQGARRAHPAPFFAPADLVASIDGSKLWLAKGCGRRYDISMEKVVTRDPEILGGDPVFAETRVPIKSLFDHLEAGDSISDFLEGFPSVKREQVLALLEESKAQRALLPRSVRV